MKRISKLYLLIILGGFMVVACGNNDELEELRKENLQLKDQISSSDNLNTKTPEATVQSAAPTEEPTEEPTPMPTVKKLTKKEKYEQYANKIKVKVYNKKNLPIDYNVGRYQEFIEIDYKVINKSPKAIKGIKGTLEIYDQFNEFLMSIQWNTSAGIIGSGKTKKITDYGINYNQFKSEENQVHSLKFKDLIFKFDMEQVNFADGYKLKLQ